MQKFTPTCRCR